MFYLEPPVAVALRAALQDALDAAIAKLPIPKVMSYAGPGHYFSNEKFVRPAHGLVALHGDDVVPVEALGLHAGRATNGHRFLSRPDIDIKTADAYAPTLEAEGKVIPSFAARRASIVVQLEGAAGDATPIMPDALLDEVTALVEWPAVYAGTFDAAFLAVPQECLILTMQLNQRYFALADDDGRLVNRFLLVSNLATQDPHAIVAGNERVLRARLADAKFFFDQDRRQRLDARVDRLRSVVHHNKLGTQAQRVDRLRVLAARIAPLVGADAALAERAAALAKADLVTDMVGEFPELQGVMGRYYAEHDGEPPLVAAAIEQHYWPKAAGGAAAGGARRAGRGARRQAGNLAGMFGIGQVPTGDKDPFGLRRAALGVIRILIERGQSASLATLVDLAFASFDAVPAVSAQPARGPRLHLRPDARLPARPGLLGEPDRRRARRAARRDRRPAGAPCRRAGVRRAAGGGRAGRRQQAHRQHPEARAATRRRPPSTARGWPTAPSTTCTWRSRSSRRRSRPTTAAAISPVRCARSRRPSRPSTGTSTT